MSHSLKNKELKELMEGKRLIEEGLKKIDSVVLQRYTRLAKVEKRKEGKDE